eukprot:jgi/Mesvir1/24358/Mv11032-RA.1
MTSTNELAPPAEAIPVPDEEEEEAIPVTSFHSKECYVYKIPPRLGTRGHRADDWNVEKWVWEGGCRVVSTGTLCEVRLEDPSSGEVFAVAPLRPGQDLEAVVEPVIDSSRYFVLRVEDSSTGKPRHAWIGIGFRDRPVAYEFQAALHDHIKYVTRKKQAEETAEVYNSSTEGGVKPTVDRSLAAGQTITLHIKSIASKGSPAKSADVGATTGKDAHTEGAKLVSPLLPPPPPAPLAKRPGPTSGAESSGSPSDGWAIPKQGARGADGDGATSKAALPPLSPGHPDTRTDVPASMEKLELEPRRMGDVSGGTAAAGADDDDFGDFQDAS